MRFLEKSAEEFPTCICAKVNAMILAEKYVKKVTANRKEKFNKFHNEK